MMAKTAGGLRERQKRERQARIIGAARKLFVEAGLDNITIEAIAAIAGVSSVTVHNYYGTKSGVLLALVAESDRELLGRLDRDLAGRAATLTDLVLGFFAVICEHATTHLDKAIWRQVIAASVSDREQRFGTLYRELDDRLVAALVREIARLQEQGRVARDADPARLGRALFNLLNARFIEFVAADDLSRAEAVGALRGDLAALLRETGRRVVSPDP